MGDENNENKGKKTEGMSEPTVFEPPPYATGGENQRGQSSTNLGSSANNSRAAHPANNSYATQNWQTNYQYSGPYVNQGFNYGGVHVGNIPPGAIPVAVANMQNGPANQMQSNPPFPPGPPAIVEYQWQKGLFSCFDNIGICLSTCICWEFTYFFIAYYSKRTGYWLGSFCLTMLCIVFSIGYQFSYATSGWHGDWAVVVTIVLYLLTLTVAFLRLALLIFFRLRIREDYDIKGNFAEDALVTCCCSPCSMCQMMSEVDHQMLRTGHRTVFSRS